jgi:hypothetical protein
MTKYNKQLKLLFPVKRVEDSMQRQLQGFKYFFTNGNKELFKLDEEDNSTNLQSTIELLISLVKGNEEVKKYLDSESGIDSSDDDFMYYYHHSLSFMIHEIFGVNVTNYAVFPNFECSAHEFYKKLSDRSEEHTSELQSRV